MIRVAVAAASLLAALPASARTAAVDMQRVFDQVAEGKAAKAELKRWLLEKQATLDAVRADLKRLRAGVDAEPDEDKKLAKASELGAKEREAKQLFDKLQKELTDSEQAALKRISDRAEVILTELQREGGYDSLVKTEKGAAPPAGATSVTDEVVKRYDARHPAAARTPSAAGRT